MRFPPSTETLLAKLPLFSDLLESSQAGRHMLIGIVLACETSELPLSAIPIHAFKSGWIESSPQQSGLNPQH